MEKTQNKLSFNVIWKRYGTIGILLLLLIVLAIAKPSAIFTTSAVPQILKQSSVNILLALGEFFAILLGYIDLSVSVRYIFMSDALSRIIFPSMF